MFHKESEIEYIKVGNQEIPFKQRYNIEKERFLVSDILDKIEESFKIRKHERILLNIDGEQYGTMAQPGSSQGRFNAGVTCADDGYIGFSEFKIHIISLLRLLFSVFSIFLRRTQQTCRVQT